MAKTRITTFALMLNSRPNRFGRYAVYIRIIQDRKVTKMKSPVEVLKRDWNPKGGEKENWVRQSDPDYAVKNDILGSELRKLKQTYQELRKTSDVTTPERIITTIAAGETSKTFLRLETDGSMTGFAAEVTKEIYDSGGIRNWKCYNGFLNKLAGYMTKRKKKEVLFSELTPEYLTRFNAYLNTLRNMRNLAKKLHPNSIAVVLKVFKALMKNAEKIGYITPDKNPFLVFTYSKVKTEKDKLDMAEIAALEALELEKGGLEWHARNCFLFSFYCAGIRVGDLLQLRWMNVEGGRLVYQMGKNHKVRDLKIVSQAAAILDLYRSDDAQPTDFVFPLMDGRKAFADAITQADRDTLPSDLKAKLFSEESAKAALLNKTLKRVALKAGITKKVSMHISRHSFASVAKRKGIDNNKVKSLLAHSRLQTTENYMGDFSTDENDQALEAVFGDDRKSQLLTLLQGMSKEDIDQVLATLGK